MKEQDDKARSDRSQAERIENAKRLLKIAQNFIKQSHSMEDAKATDLTEEEGKWKWKDKE